MMLRIFLLCWVLAHSAYSSTTLHLEVGDELDPDDFSAFDAVRAWVLDVNITEILEAINVTFPHGEMYKLYRGSSDTASSDIKNLYFLSTNDSDFEADLTVESGSINGRVGASDGTVYLIEMTVDAAEHVWIQTSLKDDNGDFDDALRAPGEGRSLASEDSDVSKEGRDRTTISQVSIKVYYTKEVQDHLGVPNVIPTISNIISTTNQGYINSNVYVRLILHCVELFKNPEVAGPLNSQTNGLMLRAFRNYKTSITELKGTADLAMLLTFGPQFTGVAYVGNPTFSIGMARLSYALNYFTFGHEVGHIFGGYHNIEEYTRRSLSAPHPYGLGYMIPSTNKRTIMSYNTDRQHPTRINHHSSSLRTSWSDQQGYRTGTPSADVVRRINERRFMYNTGDESKACEGQSYKVLVVASGETRLLKHDDPVEVVPIGTTNLKCGPMRHFIESSSLWGVVNGQGSPVFCGRKCDKQACASYDKGRDLWSGVSPTQQERYGMAPIRAKDGRWYLFGGNIGSPVNAGSRTIEVYDPERGNFRLLQTTLPNRLYGVCGALLPSGLLMISGTEFGADPRRDMEGVVYTFDPRTETLTKFAKMPEAKGLHACGVVNTPRGQIFVVAGGYSLRLLGATDTTYSLDLTTKVWRAQTKYPAGKFLQAVSVPFEGTFVVAGGLRFTSQVYKEIYIYNAATGGWDPNPGGNLTVPRGRHAGVLVDYTAVPCSLA